MTETLDPRRVRLGILAGGGSLPADIRDAAVLRGWPVHTVAIDGEADAGLASSSVTTRVNWGQIGGMLRAFRDNDVTHLAIVGRVRRPDLTRIKPDLGLVRAIPAIWRIVRAGGDDGVLRRVIRFFESHGFTVLGPLDIAPNLAVAAGDLGHGAPDDEALRDIAKGFEIVRALGAFDIGQGVVIRGGEVIAIEGAEGTDGMLARVTASGAGRHGVLVKRPKPLQDMRIDVPVIGPDTVTHAAQAGLAGIAVLAGHVLVMQRDEVTRRADAEKLFVSGVAEAAGQRPVSPPMRPTDDAEDVRCGVAILAALRLHRASRIVVVARKYVLALEAGEGSEAVLERVGGLRQWGSQRVKKRSGMAVFASGQSIEARHVDLAVGSGLRGLAAMPGCTVLPEAHARAAALQLTISAVPAAGEGGA